MKSDAKFWLIIENNRTIMTLISNLKLLSVSVGFYIKIMPAPSVSLDLNSSQIC